MDKKISQLNSLALADQADLYAVVDVSASETKKITQDHLEDTIAASTNFVDDLVGNTYFTTSLAHNTNFTTELGNDTNFINTLTSNTNFQNAVNNFITGGGSGGLSSLTQTFLFSDFVDDGSGNGIATFTDSLPDTAVTLGVVYDITANFDGGTTLKVIDDELNNTIIGASVVADAINILSGQTDGNNTSFDFGATPNPIVFMSGTVPTQGSVDVTILYSGISGSSGSKKVGVGEISDIQWFNINLPFSMVNSTDTEANVWTIVNGPDQSPSALALSNTQRVHVSTDQTFLLPDFDVSNGAYQFNSNKQSIFTTTIYSTAGGGTKKSGVGYNAVGAEGIITAQGGNTLSVGFVRSAAGQWYARTATGAAHTEVAVTIPDGKNVLRVEYDPGNVTPQARFYVDGLLVATITTNVPSAVATVLGWAGGQNTGTDVGIDVLSAPSFSVEL